jgi:hypothetical protein
VSIQRRPVEALIGLAPVTIGLFLLKGFENADVETTKIDLNALFGVVSPVADVSGSQMRDR